LFLILIFNIDFNHILFTIFILFCFIPFSKKYVYKKNEMKK